MIVKPERKPDFGPAKAFHAKKSDFSNAKAAFVPEKKLHRLA